MQTAGELYIDSDLRRNQWHRIAIRLVSRLRRFNYPYPPVKFKKNAEGIFFKFSGDPVPF